MLPVLRMAQPLVGHAHPAGEPDPPVHDEQLPVGPVIEAVELVPPERTVQHDLDARLPHGRARSSWSTFWDPAQSIRTWVRTPARARSDEGGGELAADPTTTSRCSSRR